MSPTLLTSVVGHLSRRFLPSDLTFGQPPQHLDEKQVEKDPADAAQREGLRRKRIIICCDGTWQSSATGRKNVPSNVTRLARSIARTGKMKTKDGNEVDCEQVVYYSPGIGTGDGVNIVERARQATFGDGLVSDVIKAYSFVVMNYSKYDEISCFGFSRGAYTARAVAGLITDIGIIEPRELDDFPELYALYRKCGSNDSFGFRQSPEYREWIMGVRKKGYKYKDTDGKKLDNHWEQVPHTLPAEFTRVVHVVGVFDTVGALGIPYMAWTREISNFFARTIPFFGVDEYGFHNPSLSRYINHAFHALALDDKKTAFTPTLWRLPKDHQQAPEFRHETRVELAEKLRRLLNVKHPNEKTKEAINKAWAAMVEREMWDQLKDETSTDNRPKFHKPKLQQVWFPGSHQNIGGGNPGILLGAPYDCEQLALVSFTWMCDQVRPFLNFDDEKRDEANDDGPETLSTLADREIESRKKLIEFSQQSQNIQSDVVKFGRYFLGLFNLVKTGEDNQDWALGPIIGDTTFIEGRFLLVSLFRLVLRFLFDLFFGRVFHFLFNDRTPGEYTLDDHQNEVGITNEKVHPAVRYRMEKDSRYRPGALKSFESEKKFAKVSGGNEYVYKWAKGNLTLPEYVIKPDDHISRQLISQSKKGNQWIKNL
ncbi:hypotheticall protein [Colletotrichum fructicola]|uniref:Peptidoglycan binding domain containing protein n=1 Tax=Colletotrichum fructicola (strain Nara gc5) TaxID=1213859 RepID=L2FP21_COLFN|nr:uncharacterized protein CGMCC3_g3396 [Colletotrichum fructicola]KAF4479527.1 Uncharacterized protein CGGC5_v012588 [Colletotrichum fructicola Nara gc5]KAI8290427.1 hypothetical protein K4K60_005518 [Colletotrichum sp. SAR11_57]KAE9580750.1 hypothetical protein CGMCC3_g3396 [Colletotrichum fructicola]KAF4422881.1 Uncharacterized protein CFRS1_v001152 [Colletotrichum fructicola]KAF4895985.1 hypotheticall protein [Colletotrichum fructicola]